MKGKVAAVAAVLAGIAMMALAFVLFTPGHGVTPAPHRIQAQVDSSIGQCC